MNQTAIRDYPAVFGPLIRGGVLVLATWFGAGCSDAILPQVTTWEGSLTSLSPAERINASVGVVSQSGRARTSIQMTGGTAGRSYGWRILDGTCDVQGDIVGGRAAYPVLEPGQEGTASGETVLSRELDPDGSYAAWMFRLAGGDEIPAACGRLVRGR